MIIRNQKYNFDRIVRLKLYYGSTNAESASESVVLEFAPLADAQLCPRIEAEIKDIPNPSEKNNLPGWTATIKVYNPTDTVRRILAEHITWVQQFGLKIDEGREQSADAVKEDQNAIQKYYASRVRAKLELGYWNHEAVAPSEGINADTGTVKDSKGKVTGLQSDPRRQYRTAIEGYINNAAFYRKGRDDILEMTVFAFDASETAYSQMYTASGIREYSQERDVWLQLTMEERQKRSGRNAADWDSMLRKLVANFAITRPVKNQNQNQDMAFCASPLITDADRKKVGEWLEIRYVYTPRNPDKLNRELEYRLRRVSVADFYTPWSDLSKMINDLCSWNGANVNWLRDDTLNEGKITLLIYPRGAGYQYVRPEEAEIQIVNYQNLLETPAVSASGSLHVRMFLNLDAQPLARLALILTENSFKRDSEGNLVKRTDRGGITDFVTVNPLAGSSTSGTDYYYESLSFQGTPNACFPMIMGANASSIYSLQMGMKNVINKGYLFNTGFPIQQAVHKISTHGNAWETSVVTIPLYNGAIKVD